MIGATAKNFYTDTSARDKCYPDILNLVLERVLLFVHELVYYSDTGETEEEIQANLKKRFILTDFESGDEVAIRRSIETFFNTNATFPFTAYNIGEEEKVMQKSHLQKYGKYFVPELNTYMAAIPLAMTFPMTTFFNTPHDWRRMTAISELDDSNLIRLQVPCVINDVTTSFPIDVDFEVVKGSYAWRYDEMLKTGQIYDITHNMRVYYHKFVLAAPSQYSGTGKQEPIPIYPVDSMIVSLHELNNATNITDPINTLIGNFNVSSLPVITSTTPINGATDVGVDLPIIFNTNVAMNEQSVISNIDVVPYIQTEVTFRITDQSFVIEPVSSLESNTVYTIMLNNKAMSEDGVHLESDYTLSFTTGA